MTTTCTPAAHAPAPPGTGPCPTCDRPRCNGTTKPNSPDAGRCRKQPIKGATVCRTHGGSAPHVKAAAEQRETEKKADEEIRQIWTGLVKAEPVKDPIDLLARTAGALEQMAEAVGTRVNDLNGKVATGESMSQLRAEMVLLDRVLDKLIRASDRLASLGIEEKHVELEQARAELVTAAFVAAVGAVTLLPADRDLILRTFLTQLGRGPAEIEGSS